MPAGSRPHAGRRRGAPPAHLIHRHHAPEHLPQQQCRQLRGIHPQRPDSCVHVHAAGAAGLRAAGAAVAAAAVVGAGGCAGAEAAAPQAHLCFQVAQLSQGLGLGLACRAAGRQLADPVQAARPSGVLWGGVGWGRGQGPAECAAPPAALSPPGVRLPWHDVQVVALGHVQGDGAGLLVGVVPAGAEGGRRRCAEGGRRR